MGFAERYGPNTIVEGELLLVATMDVAPLDATTDSVRLKR